MKTSLAAFAITAALAVSAYAQHEQHNMTMSTTTVVAISSMTAKGGKAAPAKKAKSTAKAEDYKVTPKEYGTKTTCPVTKDAVTVDAQTTAVKYKGKVYYFCCPACIEQFKANPQKYAK